MFRFIKNDDGIALMMVLVLLILVGGLTAALMSAGVFNIRFGGDEVERTQIFHAADAGVAFVNNYINNLTVNEARTFFHDSEGKYLIYNSNPGYEIVNEEIFQEISNNHKFKIRVDKINTTNNKITNITFSSTGKRDNQINPSSEIKFSHRLISLEDSGIVLRMLEEIENDEDYFDHSENIDTQDLLDLTTILNLTDENAEYDLSEWEKLKDMFSIYEKSEWIIEDNTNINYDIMNELRYYGPAEEEYEVEVDDYDTKVGGTRTIENSIVIVDGSMTFNGNPVIRNSIIIARDEIEADGTNLFEGSLFFSFNNIIGDNLTEYLEKNSFFTHKGISVDDYVAPDYDELAGLFEGEAETFIDALRYHFNNQNRRSYNKDWRQVR